MGQCRSRTGKLCESMLSAVICLSTSTNDLLVHTHKRMEQCTRISPSRCRSCTGISPLYVDQRNHNAVEKEKKSMKNRKIGAKIFSAFLVVIIMAFALGIGSLLEVNNLFNTVDGYAHTTVPAVTQLWTARRSVRQIEADALEATIVMTQAELNAVETDLMNNRKVFEDAINEFARLAPQYQDEVDHIHDLMNGVTKHREALFAECAKFTAEGNAAAYEIYINDYATAYEEVVDAIIEMSDDVNEQIEARYDGALGVKRTSTIVITVLLIAGVFVCIAMTVALTKMLRAPIREIEVAMKQVAKDRGVPKNEIYKELN